MVYQVSKWIMDANDLTDFFRVTKNFNKKFYTRMVTVRTRNKQKTTMLEFVALAISRQLLFLVKLPLEVEKISQLERAQLGLEKILEDDFEDGNILLPKREEFFKRIYPLWKNKYSPKKRWFIDVFAYNGFIKVDAINEHLGTEYLKISHSTPTRRDVNLL